MYTVREKWNWNASSPVEALYVVSRTHVFYESQATNMSHCCDNKKTVVFRMNVFFCFFFSLLLPLGMASLGQAKPPNILLIVSEDNGPELGCYKEPSVQTPRIDALAREGVRFSHAWVAQAGCSPSRASFLTGLYPHQHGQVGLATWNFRLYRPDIPNIVRSLNESGYRTGLIGKLHVNPEDSFSFDFDAVRKANFERKDLESYARHATEFIGAGDAPFFLSINYPDAHRPWLRQVDGRPAKPLSQDDVKPLAYLGIDTPKLRAYTADYYNCMMRLDSLVGDLLDALDQSGKADNTLVVYIGDHGADLFRGKRTCYEGGLRVPMVVRWPRVAQSGLVCDELVSTVDLMPTFLEAAGVTPVPGLAGESLVPLLQGNDADWRHHLFAEFHTHAAKENFYPQRSVRTARYKLIENLLPDEENPGVLFAFEKLEISPDVINDADDHVRRAYQEMRKPPRYELYDLEKDPYEFVNLAGHATYAATLDGLSKSLHQWRRETNDPLLDHKVLMQFKKEVHSVESKKESRKREWKYPEYFFGDNDTSVSTEQAVSNSPSASLHRRQRPNVLMIVVDDMNDWIGCLGGHPDVQTPHIDRLAQQGLLFTNAHCPAPVCNPSRTAVLTGRMPGTTGIYDNSVIWHEAMPDISTIPSWFQQHGYYVLGGGKIYHHMPGFNRRSDWNQYFDQVFDSHYHQFLNRGEGQSFHWPEGFPLNGLLSVKKLTRPPKNPREFDWGPFDVTDADMGDGQLVEWAKAFLKKPTKESFFFAVGIYRPHLPWYAPRHYFDLYDDVESLSKPPIKHDDLTDVPNGGQTMAAYRREDLDLIRREDAEQDILQAYLANISFADALVGELLTALESGPSKDNTIVVFWSDHGWHFGEKNHLHKFTLWERSTRVPLIIKQPDGQMASLKHTTGQPVGLIDLFPTLTDLCDMPRPQNIDGVSLASLLKDPHARRSRPALTTHGQGNHALRSDRYRYIRYADGGEELYDLLEDPHEWKNLCNSPEHQSIKSEMIQFLPQVNAKKLNRSKKRGKQASVSSTSGDDS